MIQTPDLLRLVPAFGEERAQIVCGTIAALEDLGPLHGFFLHGSYTRGTHAEDSDIDAVAVFGTSEESAMVVRELPARMRLVAPVLIDAYTTRFTWFGRLWTFYFQDPRGLSLDVGIISLEELQTFYVEPDAVLVCDRTKMVGERKRQCYLDSLTARRTRCTSVEFDVHHTLVKLRRTLKRGHLWNAIELVNILRRILFELIRMDIDAPEYVAVGRPERDIETVVPAPVLDGLRRTLPVLERDSVIAAALEIVDHISDLLRQRGILYHSGLLNSSVAELRALVTSLTYE